MRRPAWPRPARSRRDGSLLTTQPGDVADNGGFTRTHALAADSPAVDAIPAADCLLAEDQRGQPRPLDGDCDTARDIGAFERPCASGIAVCESDRPDDLDSDPRCGASASASPFLLVPGAGDVRYYKLGRGRGYPGLIRAIKSGADVLVHY